MKKVLSLLVCSLLVFTMAACGSKKATTEEKNAIGKLVEDGYEDMLSAYSDGQWVGIYQRDDSFMKVTADFPAETEEKYNAVDFWADDYYEQIDAIIYSLENVVVTDVSDQVPSQEVLDSYVGKTFGELESEGYEQCGYSGDEETGKYTFMYEGAEFVFDVAPDEATVIEDLDDYSDNDIRAMIIGSVTFSGFAYGFLFE